MVDVLYELCGGSHEHVVLLHDVLELHRDGGVFVLHLLEGGVAQISVDEGEM